MLLQKVLLLRRFRCRPMQTVHETVDFDASLTSLSDDGLEHIDLASIVRHLAKETRLGRKHCLAADKAGNDDPAYRLIEQVGHDTGLRQIHFCRTYLDGAIDWRRHTTA